MKKIIFTTLTVALSFALLSGCGKSETSTTAKKTSSSSSLLSSDEISSIVAGLSPDGDIITDVVDVTEETQKEVKTKTETADELAAKVLQAFCEKDAETFDALIASCTEHGYHTEYYSTVYNDWCKAADEAGIDWKNLKTKPEEWKVYRLGYTAIDFIWIEMYYPPLSDSFTFYVNVNEFDYNTETYSLKNVYSLSDGMTADELEEIDEYVNTGEPVPDRGIAVAYYSVDTEKYLN